MRPLAAAALGSAALTAVTAVVGAASASADDEVGLSRDGVRWTTTLTG